MMTLCRSAGEEQKVTITLKGDECSDYLNFVVKDASTETWYDFYGGNFHVPLRLALTSMALDEASMDEEIFIPDDQLPELPNELTGIWAYIKWESDGCPNRSQQDADAEYQRGIAVGFLTFLPEFRTIEACMSSSIAGDQQFAAPQLKVCEA